MTGIFLEKSPISSVTFINVGICSVDFSDSFFLWPEKVVFITKKVD